MTVFDYVHGAILGASACRAAPISFWVGSTAGAFTSWSTGFLYT